MRRRCDGFEAPFPLQRQWKSDHLIVRMTNQRHVPHLQGYQQIPTILHRWEENLGFVIPEQHAQLGRLEQESVVRCSKTTILLTEIISNVKAWWTWLADTGEVFLALGKFSRVHHFPMSEKDEVIKQGNNVTARLVNGENNGPIIVACKGHQALDDIECIIRVQSCTMSACRSSSSKDKHYRL
jgi:hypothetical protein